MFSMGQPKFTFHYCYVCKYHVNVCQKVMVKLTVADLERFVIPPPFLRQHNLYKKNHVKKVPIACGLFSCHFTWYNTPDCSRMQLKF